ncbi:hypothetical protein HRbin17_02295 [bacterium HR17]|uniref:PIG-L family deacetylase n=1 Tax=Candidatus Fervidibacter japonicus TaxID=2035412 RepID=A0A2H5XF19_9BACT|nr:hypothetical protein HRbin17_02295 [bacterium HR17]
MRRGRWAHPAVRWQPTFRQRKQRGKLFRLPRSQWRVWRGAIWLMLVGVAALPSLHWADRWLYQHQRAMTEPFLSILPPTALGDRIAIVAPHPDDEALGCGGLIQWLVNNGVIPHILVVTDGDGFDAAIRLHYHQLQVTERLRRAFALQRRKETLAAMGVLGVPVSHVHFLGLSERTLPTRWLMRRDERPLRELMTWLAAVQPTGVIVPSRYDDHPVHAVVCSLVWAAVLQAHAEGILRQLPRVVEYLVHYGEFPRPQGWHPNWELLPPTDLLSVAVWWRLPLPEPLRQRKAEAIAQYQTQLPLTGRFLNSFVRANELFAEPMLRLEQPDRAGEPRSLLPATDIVEIAVLPEAPVPSTPARFAMRLRGKPSRACLYGVHVFVPSAHRPQVQVLSPQSLPSSDTLVFALPKAHAAPSPTAQVRHVRSAQPSAVITAFVVRHDRVLDVAPLTPRRWAGGVHAP